MVCPIGHVILEYPCLAVTLVFHIILRVFNLQFEVAKQMAGANIWRDPGLHWDAPPEAPAHVSQSAGIRYMRDVAFDVSTVEAKAKLGECAEVIIIRETWGFRGSCSSWEVLLTTPTLLAETTGVNKDIMSMGVVF